MLAARVQGCYLAAPSTPSRGVSFSIALKQHARLKKGYPLGRTICGGGFQQAQTAFPGTVQMSALSAGLQVA